MTHMVRNQVVANSGKQADIEAYFGRLAEQLKGQAGLERATFLHSLGYPAMYAWGMAWETREAVQAWNRNPETAAFRQQNPTQDLFTPDQPGRAYELIHVVGDTSAPAKAIVAVDWSLRVGGDVSAFPDSRKEVFELRMEHEEGYLGGAVYAFSGNPRKQLVIHRLAALPTGDLRSVYPELQKFQKAHPPSQYTDAAPDIEQYEVVASAMK